MSILEKIGQPLSPSRYRGLADKSRYTLSDEFFAYEVDGCLICTDTEKDIDCDGNIVMVWPDDKVLHLGTIPQLEQDWGSNSNKVRISRSGNTLKIEYKVFYDNDHHHSGIEGEEIDMTPTAERRATVEYEYLAYDLLKRYKGRESVNAWVDFKANYSEYKTDVGTKKMICLATVLHRRRSSKPNEYQTLYINVKDGKLYKKDSAYPVYFGETDDSTLFTLLTSDIPEVRAASQGKMQEEFMNYVKERLSVIDGGNAVEEDPPVILKRLLLAYRMILLRAGVVKLPPSDKVEKLKSMSYEALVFKASDEETELMYKEMKDIL